MGLLTWIAIAIIILAVIGLGVGVFFSGALKGAETVARNPVVKNATAETTTSLTNATNASINGLISRVTSLNLTQTAESGLVTPLQQTKSLINDRVADGGQAACGKLSDFVSKVNSDQKQGKLDPNVASTLTNMAQKIAADLGCK